MASARLKRNVKVANEPKAVLRVFDRTAFAVWEGFQAAFATAALSAFLS